VAHDAAGKWVGLGVGDTGDPVIRIQHRLLAAFPKNSQAKTLGVVESGIYDQATADAVKNIQPFLKLPATGIANAATQRALGAIAQPVPAPVAARRKIWVFTAPGSGANWDQGPSFDFGERCRNELHLNHQPLSFQKGGYLGFLGGDPGFSYNEVTYDEYKSLEHCLDACPDISDPDVELWFSGYSQSADGMEDALEILFGDGGFIHPGDPTHTPAPPGKYKHLRSRINGLVQFGNPSTRSTGIANKVRPPWLDALVRNVNYDNDFYAVAPDAIRRNFYAIIVEADMSLPFFVHVLKVAGPVIMGYAPFLGPFAPLALAAMTGLTILTPLLSGLMGQAQGGALPGDEELDRKLTEMLSVTGLVSNLPGLIGLIAALPGLSAHGQYPFDPVMMDKAFAYVADFRR
jgi:hypothetical protein